MVTCMFFEYNINK